MQKCIDMIHFMRYNTIAVRRMEAIALARYIELESAYDRMPDSFHEKLMTTKQDVEHELEIILDKLHRSAGEDSWHSARYYVQMEELIKSFREKLKKTVLPGFLQDWWRYSFEISHKGVHLFIEHIKSIWQDEETGDADEETVDQVFLLVACDARMLTVDDYAELYSVEPVTVRQWIRRGKLREAEKRGNEWRISELTDAPRRIRREPSTYKWVDQIQGIPDEFRFISDHTSIEIQHNKAKGKTGDSETFCTAILASRDKKGGGKVEISLTAETAERLEMYLISSPDVLYTGNTRIYIYKQDEPQNEETLYDDE